MYAPHRITHYLPMRKHSAQPTAVDPTHHLTPRPTRLTAAMNPQVGAHIFRLPPELRNNIYEHVFAAIHDRAIGLESAQATAPRLSLSLAWRRFYHETLALHRASYTAFWSENTFRLSSKRGWHDSWVTEEQVERVRQVVIDWEYASRERYYQGRVLLKRRFAFAFGLFWTIKLEVRGLAELMTEKLHYYHGSSGKFNRLSRMDSRERNPRAQLARLMGYCHKELRQWRRRNMNETL